MGSSTTGWCSSKDCSESGPTTCGPTALKSSRNYQEDSKEPDQEVNFWVVSLLSRIKSPVATTWVHLRCIKAFITHNLNIRWRWNLRYLASLAESQKSAEANGCKLQVTKLLIINGPLAHRGLSNSTCLISLRVTSGALLEHFQWGLMYSVQWEMLPNSSFHHTSTTTLPN